MLWAAFPTAALGYCSTHQQFDELGQQHVQVLVLLLQGAWQGARQGGDAVSRRSQHQVGWRLRTTA